MSAHVKTEHLSVAVHSNGVLMRVAGPHNTWRSSSFNEHDRFGDFPSQQSVVTGIINPEGSLFVILWVIVSVGLILTAALLLYWNQDEPDAPPNSSRDRYAEEESSAPLIPGKSCTATTKAASSGRRPSPRQRTQRASSKPDDTSNPGETSNLGKLPSPPPATTAPQSGRSSQRASYSPASSAGQSAELPQNASPPPVSSADQSPALSQAASDPVTAPQPAKEPASAHTITEPARPLQPAVAASELAKVPEPAVTGTETPKPTNSTVSFTEPEKEKPAKKTTQRRSSVSDWYSGDNDIVALPSLQPSYDLTGEPQLPAPRKSRRHSLDDWYSSAGDEVPQSGSSRSGSNDSSPTPQAGEGAAQGSTAQPSKQPMAHEMSF